MQIHIIGEFLRTERSPAILLGNFLLKYYVPGIYKIFHVLGVDIGGIVVVDMHIPKSLNEIFLVIHCEAVAVKKSLFTLQLYMPE
jgi:hypothetical protein